MENINVEPFPEHMKGPRAHSNICHTRQHQTDTIIDIRVMDTNDK